MKIGVPKEIKDLEFRVGLTPAAVATLTARSHQVFVETNAGIGSGFTDDEYIKAGAKLLLPLMKFTNKQWWSRSKSRCQANMNCCIHN